MGVCCEYDAIMCMCARPNKGAPERGSRTWLVMLSSRVSCTCCGRSRVALATTFTACSSHHVRSCAASSHATVSSGGIVDMCLKVFVPQSLPQAPVAASTSGVWGPLCCDATRALFSSTMRPSMAKPQPCVVWAHAATCPAHVHQCAASSSSCAAMLASAPCALAKDPLCLWAAGKKPLQGRNASASASTSSIWTLKRELRHVGLHGCNPTRTLQPAGPTSGRKHLGELMRSRVRVIMSMLHTAL